MKKYLAEFIGAFAIVFYGCGAVAVDSVRGGIIGHVGINVAFGVIVMVMIYSFGNVSGAHFNPAVTIAFLVAKKFDKKLVVPYLISQLLGGFVGALVLKLLIPNAATYGQNIPAGTLAQAFGFEVLMTFFLMLIIHSVSTGHMEKGIMAGVAIGGYIAIEGYIAGPFSSSSMNPARSLGPAIISGDYTMLWVFMVAPVLGAVLASLVRKYVVEEISEEA